MSYWIVEKGQGNYLNPPNHAEHFYHVESIDSSTSLLSAISEETSWMPEYIKQHCRELLAAQPGDYTDQWERTCYSYFRSCYRDSERLEYGKPGTLIFPVPHYKLEPLKEQKYFGSSKIPMYTEGYLEAVNTPKIASNTKEIERAQAIAIPENHLAYIFIKSFFPYAKPRLDLIENPPNEYGKKED